MDLFDFTEKLTGQSRLQEDFFQWLKVGTEGVIAIECMTPGRWDGMFDTDVWLSIDRRFLKLAFLLGREKLTFEQQCLMTGVSEENMLWLLESIAK